MAGGETPPLQRRIVAGAAGKGDPAGRPYGDCGLAGTRADTWVRPYNWEMTTGDFFSKKGLR